MTQVKKINTITIKKRETKQVFRKKKGNEKFQTQSDREQLQKQRKTIF